MRYYITRETGLETTLYTNDSLNDWSHAAVLRQALDNGKIVTPGVYVVFAPGRVLNAIKFKVTPVTRPEFNIERLSD